MKMPISEIADRYSIVLLKHERIENANLSKELKIYRKELDKYKKDIDSFIKRLYEINGEIWDLESDIRKGKEKLLGLEEVGRRAIHIREKNKKRISIKNEMVEKYEEGFKDIKMNHASV
jgi:chromosome segregation ATPase